MRKEDELPFLWECQNSRNILPYFHEENSPQFEITSGIVAQTADISDIKDDSIVTTIVMYSASVITELLLPIILIIGAYSKVTDWCVGYHADLSLTRSKTVDQRELSIFTLGLASFLYSPLSILSSIKQLLYYGIAFGVGLVEWAIVLIGLGVFVRKIRSYSDLVQVIVFSASGATAFLLFTQMFPAWGAYSAAVTLSKFSLQSWWMPVFEGLLLVIPLVGMVGLVLLFFVWEIIWASFDVFISKL